MAMEKIIKVNPLRHSSILKALKELETYKKLLEEFPAKYTQEMMKAFNEFLMEEAPPSGIGLLKSIDVIDDGNHAEGVVVFDGHVEFIEFGTGVIGLNLHEGINDEWLNALPPPYNKGWNTGEYIIHARHSVWDLDYWKYRDDNGNWVVTNGIPANPFMYRAVERLIGAHRRIRNEVLGGIR